MADLDFAAQQLSIILARMSEDDIALKSELIALEHKAKRTLEYWASSNNTNTHDDRITLRDGRVCIGLRK